MNSIAGTVVLYNPETKTLDNLKSYIDYVDLLIVIDNSETHQESIIDRLKQNKKIIYVANNSNLGIARALNQAAEMAIQHGYNWLLTMDQDSYFDKDMISSYLMRYGELENKDNIGVIACNFSHPDLYSGASFNESQEYKSLLENVQINNSKLAKESEEIFLAITSGSMINLKIYKKIGGYEEKLFIDQVDHDYCLKVKLNNYKVIRFKNIYLNHSLGSFKKLQKILPNFPKSNFMCSHSPKRLYYRSRNNLYLLKTYIRFFPAFILDMFAKEIYSLTFNIMFDDNKTSRIKSILKGMYHSCINVYGK